MTQKWGRKASKKMLWKKKKKGSLILLPPSWTNCKQNVVFSFLSKLQHLKVVMFVQLEELRADIVDLKEMYREQVNLLVNQVLYFPSPLFLHWHCSLMSYIHYGPCCVTDSESNLISRHFLMSLHLSLSYSSKSWYSFPIAISREFPPIPFCIIYRSHFFSRKGTTGFIKKTQFSKLSVVL